MVEHPIVINPVVAEANLFEDSIKSFDDFLHEYTSVLSSVFTLGIWKSLVTTEDGERCVSFYSIQYTGELLMKSICFNDKMKFIVKFDGKLLKNPFDGKINLWSKVRDLISWVHQLSPGYPELSNHDQEGAMDQCISSLEQIEVPDYIENGERKKRLIINQLKNLFQIEKRRRYCPDTYMFALLLSSIPGACYNAMKTSMSLSSKRMLNTLSSAVYLQ